jgi:hypothetical protein
MCHTLTTPAQLTGHALEQILALRNCKATSLGARVYGQLAQAAHEESANQIEALVALTNENGDSGMGARAELSAVVRELMVRSTDIFKLRVFDGNGCKISVIQETPNEI